MTTFTITQDLCHTTQDYGGRLLNHSWVGLTGRLDEDRGTPIVRLVDPPAGTTTRQWIITPALADRIRALTTQTFTHGGVTYAAGDYVSLTYGGVRQVGVLHFEHGGLRLGDDRVIGSGHIPWVIDGNGLRVGVSDLRKLEERTTYPAGERAVIVTQPTRGPGVGSVPLTTPLVGAEVTVHNPRIDGDGELLVTRLDGSRSFYLDPACLRFYAEPGQPTPGQPAPAPEGDEAASLRAEIARVRAEHEEQMRQLGIKAQLLGRETGMCGVLEKFAEEHGIPFEGVPFRGKVTVTYSFEGNASRDWATEEQLTDRFEVSESGVSFPEAGGYDGRPATRVTSIQVEDTDFDLTIG